jgi:mono/diheme cytochrome c family protein
LTRVTKNFRTARPAGVAAASLPLLLAALLALAGASGGCDSPLDDLNMQNTPRNEPGEASDFFADGRADRDQVEHTLAQGQLVSAENRILRTGMDGDQESAAYPFEITRSDLQRGRQQFEIYCAVCHNANGDGRGMVVQRGFVPPPSLVLGGLPQNNPVLDKRTQELQDVAPGHLFKVISGGWGAMYGYNDRIAIEDRWRIAAYVKVLQLSQHAEVASLPPELQDAVKNAGKQPAPGGASPPGGHGGGGTDAAAPQAGSDDRGARPGGRGTAHE